MTGISLNKFYFIFINFKKGNLRNDGVNILKRGLLPLFLVLMVCAVSVYFYAEENVAVVTGAKIKGQNTVIIDAGHGGLTNTTH